jgi:hypothetical protein
MVMPSTPSSEELVDDPARDLLLLVDGDGGVLVLEVVIEPREQLVALGLLAGVLLGIGEVELLLDVAPEDVLHRAHLRGLGSEPFLGLLDELACRPRKCRRSAFRSRALG